MGAVGADHRHGQIAVQDFLLIENDARIDVETPPGQQALQARFRSRVHHDQQPAAALYIVSDQDLLLFQHRPLRAAQD